MRHLIPLTTNVMRQILIIDDEDDIREVAALSLEATAGWEIITACSGAAGILAAANPKRRPHAILMDVMMPGMDGPTTFRQMQQNPDIAGIPVLLLTDRKSTRLNSSHLGISYAV